MDDTYSYARGYSTGGIASSFLGVIATTRYSKTGRIGSAAGWAFAAGLVLAVAAVMAFPMTMAFRWDKLLIAERRRLIRRCSSSHQAEDNREIAKAAN